MCTITEQPAAPADTLIHLGGVDEPLQLAPHDISTLGGKIVAKARCRARLHRGLFSDLHGAARTCFDNYSPQPVGVQS